MYNQFFGFTERPFRLVPDPAYLFLSTRHEEALAHLKYAVNEGEGFVEITGEVGTGKTLLCRTFLEQLDDSVASAYIFNPRLSARELISAVNDEFGVKTIDGDGIKNQIDALNAFLIQKKAEGKKVVLVIDEAQNLGADVLEQVRLLSNLETTRSKLLQIILAGQPELGEMLDSHELRQLGQRITLSCRLRPLTLKETGDYIRHRLQVASRKTSDIFTRSAIKKIYRYSGGIPRLINIACDRALLCAYGYNQHKVSAAIADAAIAELASRGEVQRRGAWAFSPGGGRRLGLLSVLAALLLVFFFQSDIRGLLAGWVPRGIMVHQAEPAASEKNDEPSAVISDISAANAEPDGSFPPELSAGHEKTEDDTAVDDSFPAAPVPVATAADDGFPGAADVFNPPALTPDYDAPEHYIPVDRPLMISHDVVPFFDYLATIPPNGSRSRAMQTMLAQWGVIPAAGSDVSEIADDDAFFAAAAAVNGLAVQRISPDPDLIRGLNLNAILAFDGPEDQGPLYLVVVAADDRSLTLDDGASGLRITAPDEHINRQEPKEAFVFWKNFYNYQGIIPLTSPDDAVLTLKVHLRDLGFDHIHIDKEYDMAARRAVERIQAGHGIPVDGFVGPLTKMALYNKTRGLVMPRLRDLRPEDQGQSAANEAAAKPIME